MKILKKVFVVLLVLGVLGSAFFAWKAHNPGTLPEGFECPDSPNCVSSKADKASDHYIKPLSFKVDPAKAWTNNLAPFKAILLEPKRSKVISEEDGTLVVSYHSRVFGFEDQVRLSFSADGSVQVRSASRVGHYDFEVNRKRVEALRTKFAEVTP